MSEPNVGKMAANHCFPPRSRVAPAFICYEEYMDGLDRYVKQYGASV